jgi:opacity protein-like surface antigen
MSPLRTAAVVALALAIAPAASAQTTSPPPAPEQQQTFEPLPPETEGFTITPFLGVGFGGDYENSPATLGAAAGYGMNERLSVEADLFFAPGGEQGVSDIFAFDSHLWSLSANLLYHFTADDFTPYVAGGIGVMGVETDIDELGLTDDNGATKFAWNWGGGLKSAISDRFGLRADVRYFNADELVPDHWRVVGGVVIRNIGR